ncbi:SDR family NAD(P)-dependent oxidoreductase [Furfurilactobacillus rossiae]|uniref:Oxidoreductase n=1 Tax=Furfurilactobacillus rossiae DSM 15814 TaxID=1114972 RepID=A0A0R1RTZ2_9LACO|nr:SDR family NAD(P)-dependent oxidoreductase [Furfurilactobacillus rossiae]KRL57397.1 oxidoreductase [Furfurilactobacillus rossiae DSM 15814]QFR65733.1 SDR family NAD(P)-dependent oxidoreductase [Furfurilactobacillus rossiae]QLE61132.1 short-chain dehydrogenase-reductase SDR [Furfurilactobacillus rossiae]
MTETWFITGASRGLGRAIIEKELAQGNNVVATARNLESFNDLIAQYGQQIYPLTLDVTDVNAVNEAVTKAIKHFNSLDVLVNNAGFANMDSVEEMSLTSFKAQMDTDYYGTLYTIRAVLPFMRQHKSGRIINISSIGGRIGGPGLGAYQSAKFAVNGLTEVVANEVKPFGIQVTTVEPGGMRTEWGGTSMSATTSNVYQETVGRAISYIHDDWHSDAPRYVSEPSKVADAIDTLSQMKIAPVHLLIGKDAAQIAKKNADALAKSDAANMKLTESTGAI